LLPGKLKRNAQFDQSLDLALCRLDVVTGRRDLSDMTCTYSRKSEAFRSNDIDDAARCQMPFQCA
jgi:hypothetical protein